MPPFSPIRTMMDLADEAHPRDERLYHPSEAAQCALRLWFRRRWARGLAEMYVAPQSDAQRWTFFLGHTIHERIQQSYVDQGLVPESGIEVRIGDGKLVTGSIDIYFALDRIIEDLKTCSQRTMKEDHLPHYEHVVQTSIYAYYVPCDMIRIRYLCKDAGNFDKWLREIGFEQAVRMGFELESVGDPRRMPERVVCFEPRPDLAELGFRRFRQVEAAIEHQVHPDPERDPGEPGSDCETCEFRFVCRDLTRRFHPELPMTPSEVTPPPAHP